MNTTDIDTIDATSFACDQALRAIAEHQDAQAWTALFTHLGPRMSHLARRIVGPTWADDVVQETMLQIRDHARRFTPTSAAAPDTCARAWVCAITVNTALAMARTQRRRRHHECACPTTAITGDSMSHHDPAQAVDQSDLEGRLHHEIEALEDRHRRPIELAYFAGLDHRALGLALGCAPGAARMRLHRALEMLRQRLGPAVSATGLLALLSTRAQASEQTLSATGATSIPAATDAPRLPWATIRPGASRSIIHWYGAGLAAAATLGIGLWLTTDATLTAGVPGDSSHHTAQHALLAPDIQAPATTAVDGDAHDPVVNHDFPAAAVPSPPVGTTVADRLPALPHLTMDVRSIKVSNALQFASLMSNVTMTIAAPDHHPVHNLRFDLHVTDVTVEHFCDTVAAKTNMSWRFDAAAHQIIFTPMEETPQ